VLGLATIALIAWMPMLVDTGFLGWLDLPLVERAAMHLPLILTIAAVGVVVLTALGWAFGWWSRLVRLQYAAVSAAAVMLVAQLNAWGLIGWGLG
jgi:hypothetical protein